MNNAGITVSGDWAKPALRTQAEFGMDSAGEGFISLQAAPIFAPYALPAVWKPHIDANI
jgi:hypothetical protein